MPDAEYQRRVAEAVARAYGATTIGQGAAASPSAGVPDTATSAGPPAGGGGLRGYIESDRARRALSEELRVLRRAAIAAANGPVTNR